MGDGLARLGDLGGGHPYGNAQVEQAEQEGESEAARVADAATLEPEIIVEKSV